MTNGRTPVAQQIKRETGFSIGDFIVNFVVGRFSNGWIDNRTICNAIYTNTGYKVAQQQVTATMDRWYRDNRYRTDGKLYKHSTAAGVYKWVPAGEAPSLDSDTTPARYRNDEQKWVPYPPAAEAAREESDPDVTFVAAVDGGYIVKIQRDLYVAKKLEI